MKEYSAKNFEYLLGTSGLSESLLRNHFLLYQGYVKNLNKLIVELDAISKEGKRESLDYSERKRRLGWEFNGMILHELYFENLAKEAIKLESESDFFQKIVESYGTSETMEKDFRATGAMRGIGWVIMYYDPISERLLNVWIGEHDEGHLVGGTPLLVMDVFEHAYMNDYGIKKADYVDAFMKAINWQIVSERFDKICAE